jgi:hypothetical protein
VVGLAVVAAAAAACAVQFGIGVKRVIEAGHKVLHQIENVASDVATHRFERFVQTYGARCATPFRFPLQALAVRFSAYQGLGHCVLRRLRS